MTRIPHIRPMPMSMRGALLLLMSVVMLPLLVVQAGIYTAWYRTRWSAEELATLETARETAAAFGLFVRDVRRQEAVIGAELTGPHRYSPEETSHFLATVSRDYPSIRAWSWANTEGTIIASSDPAAIGLKIGDRDYFQRIRNGKPWATSDLLVNRLTGKHMLAIATGVNDKKGALLGVIIATADAGSLGQRAVMLQRKVGETLALFDPNGILVFNNLQNLGLFQDWKSRDPLLANAIKSGEAQVDVLSLEDGGGEYSKYIAARVPVPEVGWVAGARRPIAEAMASVYAGLWIAGGLNVAVAIVSGGLALWTSGTVIRRLRQLQSHAEAIGRGESGNYANTVGLHELAELASAFNQMGLSVHDARTSLEAANAALEHRIQLVQSITREAAESIVVTDPDGRVTFANAEAERTFQYRAEELLGQRFHSLVHHCRTDGGELSFDDCPLCRVYTTGNTVRGYEEVFFRKDGSPMAIECSMAPLEVGGQRIGAVQIIRDVTPRKQAEDTLRQTAERLRQSNQQLEQFAYVASHDLQEPLRVVVGYVQLLERRFGATIDAEAKEFFGYIVDGVVRMQQLIGDLLNYSRIGTKGRPFEIVDAGKALDRALANLQKVIEDSGATVIRGELPSVTGDETQLVQLFQNLIANGIKFHGERSPNIEISADRNGDGDHWVFSVRDNGIGIESQYWEQIFVIFQRLHTRHKYPGTGIGLAICKRIVDRHGGRIWVESQPGQGSTFHFTLS